MDRVYLKKNVEDCLLTRKCLCAIELTSYMRWRWNDMKIDNWIIHLQNFGCLTTKYGEIEWRRFRWHLFILIRHSTIEDNKRITTETHLKKIVPFFICILRAFNCGPKNFINGTESMYFIFTNTCYTEYHDRNSIKIKQKMINLPCG